jgi:hypothetical protein
MPDESTVLNAGNFSMDESQWYRVSDVAAAIGVVDRAAGVASGVELSSAESAVGSVATSLKELGAFTKAVVASDQERAVPYLRKSTVEEHRQAAAEGQLPEVNHFKAVLHQKDGQGKSTLILFDTYGALWDEDEISAIRKEAGKNVELAYMGKDGQPIAIDQVSKPEDLAMLQTDARRNASRAVKGLEPLEHNANDCGPLITLVSSAWNAGIRGKALFAGINPEKGIAPEESAALREAQKGLIDAAKEHYVENAKAEKEGRAKEGELSFKDAFPDNGYKENKPGWKEGLIGLVSLVTGPLMILLMIIFGKDNEKTKEAKVDEVISQMEERTGKAPDFSSLSPIVKKMFGADGAEQFDEAIKGHQERKETKLQQQETVATDVDESLLAELADGGRISEPHTARASSATSSAEAGLEESKNGVSMGDKDISASPRVVSSAKSATAPAASQGLPR